MRARNFNVVDKMVLRLDRRIREHLPAPVQTQRRPNPAIGVADTSLDISERRHSEGLMRVNHAGEVSAQALYRAQALTAGDAETRIIMHRSAMEETDHLDWCESRLAELDGHTSHLGPFWFAGSFVIGLIAGLIGDKWNLGFLVETENLVIRHLDDHLQQLPVGDLRSRAILEQMKEDEAHHAMQAMQSGAARLPDTVRRIMRLSSRVMTATAYRI